MSDAGREVPAREEPPLPKHFVVTGYACDRTGDRVLLLFHRKLQMWLPPGGHIEATEDPPRALAREFLEETGLRVRPLGRVTPDRDAGVVSLPLPHHVQVERIDGLHEHIDLCYFCVIVGGRLRKNSESLQLRWFTRRDLRSYPVSENVRRYSQARLRLGLRTVRGARRS